jgi:hypothetical protein
MKTGLYNYLTGFKMANEKSSVNGIKIPPACREQGVYSEISGGIIWDKTDGYT